MKSNERTSKRQNQVLEDNIETLNFNNKKNGNMKQRGINLFDLFASNLFILKLPAAHFWVTAKRQTVL